MNTISRIEKETRKRKILVVDDEQINRLLLEKMLEEEYEILLAANGKEALDIIKQEYKTLSIILLDLLMPVMTCFELLETMQTEKRYKNIPVIVLTSERSAEIRSLQLGAVDFIPKPYDMPEVLRARVRRSIKLAEENIVLRAVENDHLTGLYNREFFFQYAKDLNKYHHELETDTIVVNINRFHLVNELYGHSTGNELLCTVANSVKLLLREYIGLACRCDSDTFYIYLEHSPDPSKIAGRLISDIAEHSGLSKISIRIGIYENCDHSLPMEQCTDRASIACNTCRNSYSSTYAFYDQELHEKELFCEKLIRDTDKALAEGQFIVHYQPKFNIESDEPKLSSAEALIRWIHPEHGRINPGVFIPLFEKHGLIQKLDRYVWNEAAKTIAKWKKDYGITLPISVNVSRVDIYDPGLETELLKIVSCNGLNPSDLLLEITESAYSDNSTQMIEIIGRLRDNGFIIEMDDFGSGYSSLNMLSSMPIDILKLDMGFVRKICESEKDRRLVEIVLEIADFLAVPVVAEGVEKEEQYLLLKSMGCNVIQGYYFSQPVPAEMLETRLAEITQSNRI